MSDNSKDISQWKVQDWVFGAVLVILFLLLLRLLTPFFTVLLWGILFAVLFNPLYKLAIKRISGDSFAHKFLRNLTAGAFSLGTIIIILIPLIFVATQFIYQFIDLARNIRDFLASRPGFVTETLQDLSDFLTDITDGAISMTPAEMESQLLQAVGAGTQSLIALSSSIAGNVGSFGVGIVFMLFCLFFFYLDGHYLANLASHIIPIKSDYMATLLQKFKDITRNLFLGYILVALLQAVIGYIIFTIFEVQNALVFASLILICSFIPMFGASLVWLPLGIVRMVSNGFWSGLLFMLVAGTGISLSDNLLRPFLLKDRIHLHPLVIFLAILGGVQAFGFNGLILGPMVVILFLTVLDLFMAEHDIASNMQP
jgi:predicted PurR-regulated permease PerM